MRYLYHIILFLSISGNIIASGNVSAGNFTPNAYNPLAWYDISDIETISFFPGSNYVTQINDKSGNANHISQSTGAKQPLYGQNQLNSINTLSFDGNQYLFKDPGFLIPGDLTIFAVVDNWDTEVEVGYIIENCLVCNSGNQPSESEIYNHTFSINASVQGKLDAFWEYGNGADVNAYSDANIGLPGIITWYRSSIPKCAYFKMNSSIDYVDYNVNATGGGTSQFVVGSLAANGVIQQRFIGDLAELIVYDRLLSQNERAQIENYLSKKWSVSI